jgi:hypothetical protein
MVKELNLFPPLSLLETPIVNRTYNISIKLLFVRLRMPKCYIYIKLVAGYKKLG